MGYIKEPDNVDFVINGKPWTTKEKQDISDYIEKYKIKMKKKKIKKTNKKLEVS